MGPKKKERDTDHSSSSKGGPKETTNGRADTVQADHELFLQAFESKDIPTSNYF
jgi:hypothetical protein